MPVLMLVLYSWVRHRIQQTTRTQGTLQRYSTAVYHTWRDQTTTTELHMLTELQRLQLMTAMSVLTTFSVRWLSFYSVWHDFCSSDDQWLSVWRPWTAVHCVVTWYNTNQHCLLHVTGKKEVIGTHRLVIPRTRSEIVTSLALVSGTPCDVCIVTGCFHEKISRLTFISSDTLQLLTSHTLYCLYPYCTMS